MGSSVFPAPSSSGSSVVLGAPVNLIPSGLTLRHTYTSTQSVSIGTSPVFVVLVGGGGGGSVRTNDNTGGGGSGGITMGWCAAPTSVTVGAAGTGAIYSTGAGGISGGATSVNTFPVDADGGSSGQAYQSSGTKGAMKTGVSGQSWDLIPSLRNGSPGGGGGQQGEDVGFCTGGGGSSSTGAGGGGRGGNSSIFSTTGGAGSGALGGGGAGVVGNGSSGSSATGGAGGTGGGGGGASSFGTNPIGGAGGVGAVLIYY